MSRGERWIVLGGGVAGLVAAHTIQTFRSDSRVTLVERSRDVGGLLAGQIFEPEGHYFDQGTHIFRETGVAEIDDLFRSAVASDNLLLFPPGQGDLAGAILDGKLQDNSHFPDIRRRDDYAELRDDLMLHASGGHASEIDRTAPALDEVRRRFGDLFARRIMLPILSQLYQLPPESLAAFAFLLPGLTRTVALDEAEWLAAAEDNRIREIIAVPDQRRLPSAYQRPLLSFYARAGGSRAVINTVREVLERRGVEIRSGVSVGKLDIASKQIAWESDDGGKGTIEFDGLVLAVGAIGAARALGVDMGPFGFDRPVPHRLVHLVMDEIRESDLCYFYGLDPSVDFYRVTNYRAFSGDSRDRRLTVEVLGDRADDDRSLIEKTVSQLKALGFVGDGPPRFANVTRLPAGFPSPTIRNLAALQGLSKHLTGILPDHVVLGGVGAKSGLFFQNEVVSDLFATLRHRLTSGGRLPAGGRFGDPNDTNLRA